MDIWKDIINAQIDNNSDAVKELLTKAIQTKSTEIVKVLRQPTPTE